MKKLLETIEKSFQLEPPKGFLPDTKLVPLDGKSEDESLIFGTPDAKGLRPDQMPSDMQERQDGYFVVGFWGHGINSYAFQYNRKNSWSEFSLRMPYGGVYMDNNIKAGKITDFITKYFAFEQQLIESGQIQKIHIAAFDNMGSGFYEVTIDGKEPIKFETSFMDQDTVQQQVNELLSSL